MTGDLERAFAAAAGCDLFVAAGTSLLVGPVNQMFDVARRSGAATAIVTASDTPYDEWCQLRIHAPVEVALPAALAAARGSEEGGRMDAASDRLAPGDALLLVDVQNDFCPGGALPVGDGDRVVAVLNRWIGEARRRGVPVYASQDWHPPGHPSFAASGGPWPPHCLQGTRGAAFHPELALPADAVTVLKGTRFDRDQLSAFDETGLAERLARDGVRRLWVGGLAQDVCVRASVLDALAAGFEVCVIVAGTRPVDEAAGRAALREMEAAGARLEVRA